MRKKVVFFCLIIINLLLPTIAISDSIVSITLPTFNIKINNEMIENDMRKYPFIVYNDITYIPTTYHDSKFLCIETQWNPYNGLIISQIDDAWLQSSEMQTFVYAPEMQSVSNPQTDQAHIATEPVKINGEQLDIDSNIENVEYPLLIYRDITYFPLTWHYAVEKFGWEYYFDSISGLVITSRLIN